MRVSADVTLYWTWEGFEDEFRETIAGIAQKASWDMPGMEVDDLRQELWLYAWENWDNLQVMEAGLVVKSLKRAANKAARREKLDYLEFRGVHLYTTGEVRGLMERIRWDTITETPDLEGYIDVMDAYKSLTPNRRTILYRKYGLEAALSESDRRTERRAIQEMTEYLNLGKGHSGELSYEDIDNYMEARRNGSPW